jgi:hypothetical protein
MEDAQNTFRSLVESLKPMLAPSADVDLELCLFETISVVPGKYETQWLQHVEQGQYLEAKKLIVNLDLRAWLGKTKRAAREGCDSQRRLVIEKNRRKKGEQIIALFKYETEPYQGLRLDIPLDESQSNIDWCPDA